VKNALRSTPLREGEALNALKAESGVRPVVICDWKKRALPKDVMKVVGSNLRG